MPEKIRLTITKFNAQFFTDCLCTGIYSCTARNRAGVVSREMALIIESKSNNVIIIIIAKQPLN